MSKIDRLNFLWQKRYQLQWQNAPILPYKFGALLKILTVAGKIKKPANSKICRLLKVFETFCAFLSTLKSWL
jgi:hypothetical protein